MIDSFMISLSVYINKKSTFFPNAFPRSMEALPTSLTLKSRAKTIERIYVCERTCVGAGQSRVALPPNA